MKPQNKRSVRFIVKSKQGIHEKYRVVNTFSATTKKLITQNIPDAVDLEKKLNNGLLAYEAEAAYARAGFHNKEIFKVHVGGMTYTLV